MKKAIAAARLAACPSTTESERATAGYTAGRLAHAAGMDLDALATAVPQLVAACDAWAAAVDGWYDAAEA
jgi:hypothetical protein